MADESPDRLDTNAMSKATTDEVLAARVLPVLRSLGRPADCVELQRLVHSDDSSAIYRVLCKSSNVRVIVGRELTRFEWAG